MDGDGQSMLSIVQSLRDSGLVVTLVNGKYGGNRATAMLAINTASRPHERRSLGINTKVKSIQHSSTQANDSRYASVYQRAHCGLKPTSPCVHLPEFPPQRATPSLTEGNFEVRGWRNRECQYTPVRTTHSCRGNLRWTDRVGSVNRWSEDTSAFAHSLRKYPNLSPNRSLSTELVQRLLTYTQNKSFSKSSYHTHNARTTRPTSPVTTSIECTDKSVNNIQSYARNKFERSDKAINTANETTYPGKLSEKNKHSMKKRRPSNMYDYLKRTKPRGWNTRGTEVRYLTDVTKCIKDAIRSICDEAAAPVMCPRVQNRYSQHRRIHQSHTNGQQPISTSSNTNGEAATIEENNPCAAMRCGPPNNVCEKIQTRYNQHKKKHNGQNSCSDLKNIEIQACSPPVREACVMTRFESSTALSHVCLVPEKTGCYCKRPLPCHCRSKIDRGVEKEVLDWIKEMPVYSDDTKGNKYLRGMLSKKLVEALQKIIIDGDFEKIRAEIDKCLNVLPMWCPENVKDKMIFKNLMAENIMNRLKQYSMDKDFSKDQIILWFNELPFKDEIKPDHKEQFLNDLVHRLKAVNRLTNDSDYKEALKNEIVQKLYEIPAIDKDVIMCMANTLANNLIPTEAKEKPQDKLRTKILDWIDNTSFFAENGFNAKDNMQFIDDLSRKLTQRQQTETDSENVEEPMIKDIVDWLQNACKSKNVLLDINTKNKLAQKLINKIYPNLSKTATNQYLQAIFDWLGDTPELSHCRNETILIERLANKLPKLQQKGYGALLEVIIDWINQLCEKHDKNLDPVIVRQVSEKFMNKLELQKQKLQNSRKHDKKIQETISNEISHILENVDIPLNSNVKNNLQNKITNMLCNNKENLLSNETTTAKKDLIKLLQHEGNMTSEEAKDLASNVINSTQTISLSEIQKSTPPKSVLSQSMKGVERDIKKEVDESHETDVEYKEALEETVSQLLPDEIIRGTNSENIKDGIYQILGEDSILDEQIGDITSRLEKGQREMSLEPTSSDVSRSNVAQQRQSVFIKPRYKDTSQQNVERTIFNFINDVLVNHSSKSTENIRTGAKAFVDNVSQLIQRNVNKESVLKEVQSFLNNVPISSEITRKELTDELTNRLLGVGFQTSTPRKDFSFQPRRLTFDSSLPSVCVEDDFQEIKQRSEENYREDLTKVVKNWLDRMQLGLNNSESKRFKEIVINDLVGDMVDRQKYLQLNPAAKSSDTEELENLKYQVFRWLNKVMDAHDFDTMMPQTEALMDAVKEVVVPQLSKPSGIRKNVKKSQGQVPNFLDALQDEISVWVDDIPKHLHQSTDKKYHNQMVGELAKNLQYVDSKNVDNEIKKWLRKYFRYSDQDINKVAQYLYKKLIGKGFSKDISWMVEQDSSEFIEENLYGGILDWLKGSPYYQFAHIQDRNTHEKIVAEMAKGIKKIIETALTTSKDVDTDELFMDEIFKHLKRFPLGMRKKSDTSFLKNTATNLLQHLKGLQMFQNISDRYTANSGNNLNISVEDCINSIQVDDKQNLSEGKHFESLIELIKHNLCDIKEQGDEKGLREEIKNLLKKLPIDPMKLNDEKCVNKIVEEILKNIKTFHPEKVSGSQYEDILVDIDSSFGPRNGAKTATDILLETVNIFCDNLLVENGKLSKDTEKIKAVKQNIASKLMKRIEELNMNSDVINNDLLYRQILEGELDNLISVSQPSAQTEGTINELKRNLINKVMEAKDNAKSELTGQIYKQQLRDTISKTLTPAKDLSGNVQTSFEILSDNIADAYINLRFYGSNTEEREKYKNRINKEISKFCNDYLKKHPSTPIESEKLNKELYAMLNNVSFSTNNSIRDVVEQTKIKDLVRDYAYDLPLRQETSAEKMQTNKLISLMSKRLHEMEKDADLLEDYEEKLKSEIIKWIKKLPLKNLREEDIIDFADKLVHELKRTESLRKFNSTTTNIVDFDQTKDSVTPPQVSEVQSRPSRITDNVTPRLPPSTLSSEDRDHLQRVRERFVSGKRIRTTPIRKDAAISPEPIDAESQTGIRPCEDSSSIQRSPSIQAATQIDQAPHVCQSPVCGLRRIRPCLQSESPHCHVAREKCWPMQDQRERFLPCDIIEPEPDVQDLRSSSCECQPNFIPYSFSPRQGYAIPRPCVPPPRPAPNLFRPFQSNSPEDIPTSKRSKRKDHSPLRREERPRKTIRPLITGHGSRGVTVQGTSKGPKSHEQTYGIRHLHGAPLCRTSSRRGVLISDDEFDWSSDIDNEENFKCSYKDRDPFNNYGRDRGFSYKSEYVNRCPKCCGVHCPHPSHLYFRN